LLSTGWFQELILA